MSRLVRTYPGNKVTTLSKYDELHKEMKKAKRLARIYEVIIASIVMCGIISLYL